MTAIASEPRPNGPRLRRNLRRCARGRLALAAAAAGLVLPGVALAGPVGAAGRTAGTAAGASVLARPAERSQAPSAPPCAASGLVVWLDTTSNGAAGSFYYKLEMTNLSGRRCSLTGYPGVSAVDLAGHQLGSAALRNPQHAPATVTLADGASAVAVLQMVDVGNYPPSRCKPVTAAGLRVYPPNDTRAEIVPYPFRACSLPGETFLAVEAVQPAAAAP